MAEVAPVRAFLDTNVLYGAYLKRYRHQYGDTSASFAILERALASQVVVVVSDVVVAELVGRLLDAGETMADINEFFAMVSPVLSPESHIKARIGKDYVVDAAYAEDALDKLGDLLINLCPDYEEQIRAHPEVNSLRGQRDDEDLHVMVSAVEERVDYIITSNTSDFPPYIGDGDIKVLKPGAFLAELEQTTP